MNFGQSAFHFTGFFLSFHFHFVNFIFPFSRWYFGKIKRVEAEKKLLSPENEHGAFLIRDSESRRNDYSLSGMLTAFVLADKLRFAGDMLFFFFNAPYISYGGRGGVILDSLSLSVCPSVILSVCVILSGRYLLNHRTIF